MFGMESTILGEGVLSYPCMYYEGGVHVDISNKRQKWVKPWKCFLQEKSATIIRLIIHRLHVCKYHTNPVEARCRTDYLSQIRNKYLLCFIYLFFWSKNIKQHYCSWPRWQPRLPGPTGRGWLAVAGRAGGWGTFPRGAGRGGQAARGRGGQ